MIHANGQRRRIAAAVLLVSTATAAQAQTPTAAPAEGKSFEAQLTTIDADWQLGFNANRQQRTVAAAELVCWGNAAEPKRGPVLVTAAGELLPADVYRTGNETLTVDSKLFGPMRLPWGSLAGIVFDLPATRADRDALFDRLARAGGNSDRLVLHNGDEITGILKKIDDEAVHVQIDAETIEIQRHRIAALILNPGLRRKVAAKGLRAWVGFRDGTRLIATRLTMGPSSLKIRSVAAGVRTTDSPGDLVFLQPLGGRATYLSDLKATGYNHLAYLDLHWPYGIDRCAANGRLRSGGRLYLKGLGMHTMARLTYSIDAPYKQFQAELAVDDSAGGGGSVRYRVRVDGKVKFTSETVRGGDAPVPIVVDISGAKSLDLIVDYAERADELDHADWLNARFVK